MHDFIILSTKEPQYIFLSQILRKKKFDNHYFIESTRKTKLNSFLENLKKSLKSKKKIKFIIYYLFQILFFKRYSTRYSLQKKRNTNKKNTHNIDGWRSWKKTCSIHKFFTQSFIAFE